jgi:hypothetical protein
VGRGRAIGINRVPASPDLLALKARKPNFSDPANEVKGLREISQCLGEQFATEIAYFSARAAKLIEGT